MLPKTPLARQHLPLAVLLHEDEQFHLYSYIKEEGYSGAVQLFYFMESDFFKHRNFVLQFSYCRLSLHFMCKLKKKKNIPNPYTWWIEYFCLFIWNPVVTHQNNRPDPCSSSALVLFLLAGLFYQHQIFYTNYLTIHSTTSLVI